ncbi:hypothetical protein BDZ45DRAFT_677072 [Acephala macrosclerotiorum]|nr:hypothetical protein BDZ45DRAFT_677072 [Acephala macrosclerotiorum]
MKQLNVLMNDTAKFKSEYGLEILTMDEKLSVDDLDVPKTGLRRLFARMKPEFQNQTARRLQEENKVWRRLKWASIDKVGIEMLVNDIRRKIDKLYDLLQDDDQRFIKHGIEALLRHAVSQASESSDLSAIEQLLHPASISATDFEENSIKTALSLKKRRLMLDFGQKSHPNSARSSNSTLVASNASSTSLSVPAISRKGSRKTATSRAQLSWKLLERARHSKQDIQAREMATYDGLSVLVEWKSVERGVESKLKHRIKSLATLLQDMDSSTFHSLSCVGYLKNPDTGDYGYVFQPPNDHCEAFTSLSQIMGNETLTPSLNDRFTLAIALTETVLQLHTSGWLHKGIRSENVLLFPDNKDSTDIARAFLGGYEYARADNPSDMTESPAMQQESNLYRHPALLRANRASFQKAFDLYALGCVLIEIGLWSSMITTLIHFLRRQKGTANNLLTRVPDISLTNAGKAEMTEASKEKFRFLTAVGKGSITEALEFTAGKTFATVVNLCLTAGGEKEALQDDDDDEVDDKDDRCIGLEIEILEKLRSCRM